MPPGDFKIADQRKMLDQWKGIRAKILRVRPDFPASDLPPMYDVEVEANPEYAKNEKKTWIAREENISRENPAPAPAQQEPKFAVNDLVGLNAPSGHELGKLSEMGTVGLITDVKHDKEGKIFYDVKIEYGQEVKTVPIYEEYLRFWDTTQMKESAKFKEGQQVSVKISAFGDKKFPATILEVSDDPKNPGTIFYKVQFEGWQDKEGNPVIGFYYEESIEERSGGSVPPVEQPVPADISGQK